MTTQSLRDPPGNLVVRHGRRFSSDKLQDFPGRPGSQFPVTRIDHLDVITIQESSRQRHYFPQRPPQHTCIMSPHASAGHDPVL